MKRFWVAAGILAIIAASIALPCTIISGKAKNNEVWAGNNEDFYFDFNTYLNVLPREGELLGAVSFTYRSPDSFIQGGFNEAGLFFDFNALPAIPESDWKDWGKRKKFPGSEQALVEHMLRKCATVQDVIDLTKEYEMQLTNAQIHLADKQGNLAVINESGIRISQSHYQVSTNFNIFTRGPSDGGPLCWRYPIAERMFKEREVSLETIRDILDATQQPRYVGTIYSNVINLTTGDATNYFAGDFKNPYHFNLKELLKKGKKSFLWRSLFPDAPIVRIWETYLAEGSKAALELFRKIKEGIPQPRRSEILRHVFSSCVLSENKYVDAKVFFDEWLAVNDGKDKMTNFYQGLVQLTNGAFETAKASFAAQINADTQDEGNRQSSPSAARAFLDKLKGETPAGANTRFELKGYQDAKFVCVVGIGWLPISNFLLKTDDGWAADFALPPGKNHYAFLVDGKTVFDPANPEKEEIDTEDGKMTLNVVVVK
ncbi:MAG: hypothetical protein JXB23_10730 [Candidatus Aminicenantes bacterium]|nr:hypothetical protein [Candidatus Aminicenantes bacterium]